MEIIAAVGFIATFLGVCIAVSAYFNGKHIKAGVSEIGKIIDGIKDLLNEMQRQGEQRHKEVLETADQRHKEVMETADQRHKEVIQLIATIKGS